MNRKEELKIIIESLTNKLFHNYERVNYEDVDTIIEQYPKIKEKQEALANAITEYQSLN